MMSNALDRTSSAIGIRLSSKLREDTRRALGSDDEEIDALPRFVPSFPISTPEQSMGCMYVLEGMTLGGRTIVRALRDHLGVDGSTGGAFFVGYGAETGPMWKSFVTELDRSTWPQSETISAAIATFESLEDWLRACDAGKR